MLFHRDRTFQAALSKESANASAKEAECSRQVLSIRPAGSILLVLGAGK
jgi:hypothetical protein